MWIDLHITSNNRSFTNDQNGVSTKTINHVFLDCLGSIMHLPRTFRAAMFLSSLRASLSLALSSLRASLPLAL